MSSFLILQRKKCRRPGVKKEEAIDSSETESE
jgi:hypothetical protein